jgi:hypothetical protein
LILAKDIEILMKMTLEKNGMKYLNEKIMLSRPNFQEYCQILAQAYLDAPKFDPKVVKHWEALKVSNNRLYKHMIGKGYKIQIVKEDPYKTQAIMKKEVLKTKILKVWGDFKDHPYFSADENFKFRAVHDFYAHILGNAGFGGVGEIHAYNVHAKIAPKEALPALFMEIAAINVCISQGNSTPRKIAVLKGFDYRQLGLLDGYQIVDKKLVPINNNPIRKIAVNEQKYSDSKNGYYVGVSMKDKNHPYFWITDKNFKLLIKIDDCWSENGKQIGHWNSEVKKAAKKYNIDLSKPTLIRTDDTIEDAKHSIIK